MSRDKVAMSGVVRMVFPARAPTKDVQWSSGVASPCFVLVTWNLIQVLLGLDLEEEESSSVLISPLKSRRSSAVPSSFSTFSLLWLASKGGQDQNFQVERLQNLFD